MASQALPPHKPLTSKSTSVHERNLFSTIVLVCDIRLGILLAGELGLLTSETSAQHYTVILLLWAGMSWLPMWLIHRHPNLLINKWYFPCADLVSTGTIILTLPSFFEDALYLSLAYALASALLIGLTSTIWTSIWTAGIISVIAATRLGNVPMSSKAMIASALGICAGILLGHRLRVQFEEVGRLSAAATAARADERALAERLVIARDLHDSLAKSVHGIRMLTEALDASLQSEHHGCAPLSHTLFESADEASREARLVLDGLRVSTESDAIGALADEVSRWSGRTGITATCNVAEPAPHLSCSPESMWQLQRILGEALTNIEKHAYAHTVRFNARVKNNVLFVEVTDDGVGLRGADAGSSHSKGHYGLAGMQERAHALGAALTIDSRPEPGVGLRTRLRIPLQHLTAKMASTTDSTDEEEQ